MGNYSYYQDGQEELPEFDSVADFAENIVYLLPGCDKLMIVKTIQLVFRDFCRRSCVLSVVHKYMPSPDGRYPVVAITPDCIVDTIASVSVNGRMLNKGDRKFHAEYRVEGNVVVTGAAGVTHSKIPDGVDGDEGLRYINVDGVRCCHHSPNRCDDVEVVAIEVPVSGSEKAPRWFIRKYEDAIVSGVIARLTSMTNKPWSDPAQAQLRQADYENAVNSAKMAYYGGGNNLDNGSVSAISDYAL